MAVLYVTEYQTTKIVEGMGNSGYPADPPIAE